MKTAISLPDSLFDEAEKTARSLGIPRSRLFAEALEEFINRHKRERITERLNEVYNSSPGLEESEISKASLDSLRELTKNDAW